MGKNKILKNANQKKELVKWPAINYKEIAFLGAWPVEPEKTPKPGWRGTISIKHFLFGNEFIHWEEEETQYKKGRKIFRETITTLAGKPQDFYTQQLFENEKRRFFRLLNEGFESGKLKNYGLSNSERDVKLIEFFPWFNKNIHPTPIGFIESLKKRKINEIVDGLKSLREIYHDYIFSGKFPSKVKSKNKSEKVDKGGRPPFDPDGKVKEFFRNLKDKDIEQVINANDPKLVNGVMKIKGDKDKTPLLLSEIRILTDVEYSKNFGFGRSTIQGILTEVYKNK